MDFTEIIRRQREVYLKQLTEFYHDRISGAKEILLELNGDEKERIFKLYRLDYFEKVDGQNKPIELGPDKYLDYPPTSFSFGQLNIELNPFYWHGCNFVFDDEFTDLEWLKSWTKKWIDEDDINPIDSNGLSGVIHNVTRPKKESNGFEFSVDFGTASEDSFIELLQTIEEQGIKKVRIGSFRMIE